METILMTFQYLSGMFFDKVLTLHYEFGAEYPVIYIRYMHHINPGV